MLIRKIDIRNFQVHKKLTFELDMFTLLVGPSSAGKTTALRGLAWLFYGDWDQTFPNDPELDTSVAIQLENGDIWARFRKGKSNRAIYRKPGEKPLVYQDFGDIVPGLLEAVNVRPIKLGTGKVNLNFSMQDDPIFMVHDSKPAKAQWIGRLYGAHIINSALRLMAKDKRALEAEKKASEDEEARLRAELLNYEGLEEQSAALDKVDLLLIKLMELNNCQSFMTAIMQDHEAIKNGARILDADTDGIKIDLARLEMFRVAQDIRLSVQREEWALAQSKVGRIDTAALRAEVDSLQAAKAKLEEYRQVEDAFEEVTHSRHAITNRMEAILPQLDALRASMKDYLFAEGRCPLCMSKPKKIDVESITNNLHTLVGE